MEASAYLWSKQVEAYEQERCVTFSQNGVFVHLYIPTSDDDKIIGGTLTIVEEGGRNLLEWQPSNDNTSISELPSDQNTEVLSVSSSAVVGHNVTEECPPGQEERAITPSSPVLKDSSDPDWTVVNGEKKPTERNESFEMELNALSTEPSPPKYDFSVPLQDIRFIKRSDKNVGWRYLVLELRDGGTLPPLHFHQGGCKNFIKAVEMYVPTAPSTKHKRTIEILRENPDALAQSFDKLDLFGESQSQQHHQPAAFTRRLMQDPVSTALGGFSRVTNFLQDMLNPQEMTQTRPAHERASVLDDEPTGASRIQIKPEDDTAGGFEVITCAQLEPRTDPPRGKPLNEKLWMKHKDPQGRIVEVDEVKNIIFRGGVEQKLRKEVWKYLLGFYEWNMTLDEVKSHRRQKEDDYYRIKMQWKSIDEDQEKRFSAIRENKSLIEKDVVRTDRDRDFYEGNDNVSLKLLNDVLMTYVMYNFDQGYVQGMSDLLAPILEVMGNEVDAFWCFIGFMNIVQHNFDRNQLGMKRQLHNLSALVQFVDPKLFDVLLEKEATNFYYCFRWLLIRFKREFTFEDIQTLWEVCWTGLPCPNFHLVICLAILDTEKSTLADPEYGFTEILGHINKLVRKIDLDSTLSKAEGLYLQIATSKRDRFDQVNDILGLPVE